MRRTLPTFAGAAALLVAAALANLAFGASAIAPGTILRALFAFDGANYDHFVVLYQRLPRALIAMFVGAVMACGGAVLQGLTRNPLASPGILGINAGATLFVIASVFVFDLPAGWQGLAAITGGLFGFLSCLFVAGLTGAAHDRRGLSLILSGAVLSMLYASITGTLMLASPSRRNDFPGWVSGNINHAFAGWRTSGGRARSVCRFWSGSPGRSRSSPSAGTRPSRPASTSRPCPGPRSARSSFRSAQRWRSAARSASWGR